MGRIINQRPGPDAIFVSHDVGCGLSVLKIQRIDVVFVLDHILFAVRHVQFVRGSLQIGCVGLHVQSDRDRIFRDAGKEGCRVIPHIAGLENDLKLSTGLKRVRTEQVVADVCSASCFDTEIGIAITIQLVPTISPVEII